MNNHRKHEVQLSRILFCYYNYILSFSATSSSQRSDYQHMQDSSYLQQYQSFLVDKDAPAQANQQQTDHNLLFDSEDQLTPAELDSAFAEEDSFIPISPSMPCSNYLYGLDGGEGISELFDIDDSHLTSSER